MEHREHDVSISTGTVIKVLLVVVLFAVVFILRDILLILLMSIVIASAIEPATQWLMRRRLPRLFSVILVYLAVIAAIFVIIFFLLVPLLSESIQFLSNFPNYFNPSTVATTINKTPLFSSQFAEGIRNSINLEQIIGQINDAIATLSSNAFGSIAKVFGGILSLLLIFVLSFYLAVEEDGVGKFLKMVAPVNHERYTISLWRRSQRKIGLWMQGQLVLAGIIGLLVYLGLTIVGMPNPLLLAVLAAAFEIIPLFGPILASIPAITVSFVTGGFSLALLVVGLYVIIHQFENQLIYPLVVKKVVGVNPVVSIVALVAGWELLGFFGVVLSVPVASVLIEFFDDYEKDKIEKMSAQNG